MNDIIENTIIKQLNTDFVATIKFVYIYFGGKSIVCVSNDDNLYSYGSNFNGYLGLGHQNPIDKPTIIEELCNKQVIVISNTRTSLVALTKNGHIYSWGCNDFGQIGNGCKDNCLKPVIIKSLLNIKVIDVKCGLNHCLALTLNGEVFEWGWSVSGNHNTVPIRVICLELHNISAISCGEYHSLVLTDNGDVFSWGKNNCGQCGIGNNYDQYIPIKVENLNDVKIVKISCGPLISLLLSDCGDIYVFGNTPTKLDVSIKFVDIESYFYNNNVFIGLSNDGFCFNWEKREDKDIAVPIKTDFTDIDETFASFTKYKYKTYYLKKTFENIIASERLKKAFNKQELSDISFKIDGKYIYTHKLYLKTVCKHFNVMFAPNVWLESNAKEVEITQYSYSVYYSFLKFK